MSPIMGSTMVDSFSKITAFLALMVVSLLLVSNTLNQGWFEFQKERLFSRQAKAVSSGEIMTTAAPLKENALNSDDAAASPVSATKCNYASKKKAVLIFAPTRSGSSFLGEFFNQHSEIYYLFEPLHGMGIWRKDSQNLRQIVLDGIFKCDYSRVVDIYSNGTDDGWPKCRSNICFSGRSKFLWRNTELCVLKEPFCGVKSFDKKVLEKICKQSMFTAAKVVVMPSLAELESFVMDPQLDLRVIQLVRDPRAVVPSQVAMVKASQNRLSPVAGHLCRYYTQNYQYVQNCMSANASDADKSYSCNKTLRELWKGRFMRISHEYVSERPFDALKAVYDFVGLNFDRAVADWLTKSTEAVKDKMATDAKDGKDPRKGFFGTVRNSTAMLNAWRLKQSFGDVSTIQEPCLAVMNELGYIPVWDKAKLVDTTNCLYDLRKAFFTS